ncbi:MAG TPA: DegT/DnrJ/EryC1/StrS family aminotransferase [Thermomicrobiales bacterium]
MTFAFQDWPPFRPDALSRIEKSLRSGILVDGPNTSELERAWAEDTGAPYCLACSSGTAALYLALAALGVEGKEVIVPAFTFSGSVFPIIMAGAKPVFADVDPATYCVTAETVQRVLSPRTAAVMPVHLHGYPVDLRPIQEILPPGVHIIEDACQAAGTTLPDGRRAGRFGLAGAYSLNQTKAFPAGEGGLVVTDDPDFYERMRTLRRFGEKWDERSPRTYIVEDRRGGNYRIDELCAAVALSHLPHLAEVTELARRNAETLLECLSGLPGLRLPASDPGHSWQKFRVRTASAAARDRAMARMEAAGIPVCRWQVAAMPDHTAFRDPSADVPVARELLEDSFLFFTERWPLHHQPEGLVEAVGAAIRQAWQDPT